MCLSKWGEGTLLANSCGHPEESKEMRLQYNELKKLWTNLIPEFYPMGPDFKQFTNEDIFCLLSADDYSQCIGQNGPLHNIAITQSNIHFQYQGCHNTARNLLTIDEITRAEMGRLNIMCKEFSEYLLKFRNTVEPFEKASDSATMGKEDTACLFSQRPEVCEAYVAGPFGFVDRTKNSQFYLDRYFYELGYKEWFDSNYPGSTIYDALGITEEFVNSEINVVLESQKPSSYAESQLNACKRVQMECNEQCGFSPLCDPNECAESRGCGLMDVREIYAAIEAEKESEQIQTTTPQQSTKGGGCLIATATFGSELAPQVQQLREIRDNSLLQTESGRSFMESFNQFYYSFSPTIADLERENPIFKEAVKLTITPLLSSLSLLNYVNMDSEVEVLGYGISLIILNVGMYFALPAIVIHKVRKFV